VATIVRDALDALQAAGTELRVLSASVVLFGAVAVGIPFGSVVLYFNALAAAGSTGNDLPGDQAIALFLAAVIGFVALVILLVQIPLLVLATVGARVAGAPITLRQALRRARQVFLRGLGAAILVGLLTSIPTGFAQAIFVAVLGETELATGLTLLAGTAFASPWVYVLPGIVLGGVATMEALRRSWAIARVGWRIAITISLLGVVGQFVVVAAASAGLGALVTALDLAGATPATAASISPAAVVVLALVALVIAASLVFGVQLVQYAPQAAGFYALTGYTRGLDAVREGPPEPLFRRRALVFYGIGILAGLYVLAAAIGPMTG
jgi:hypothetical protein